jgi:hypothetical protein
MTIDRFHSFFSRRFFPRTHLCFEFLSGCCAHAVIIAERCGYVFHCYFSHERRLASCFVIQE